MACLSISRARGTSLNSAMRRAIYFVAALVFVLGVITWFTATLVEKTIRDWFENDVRLRAQLAVNGARQSLLSNWSSGEFPGLQNVLAEIAHDERIMGVAACAEDLTLLSQTKDFPAEISCLELGPHVRPASAAAGSSWTAWNSVRSLPGGKVHVSAIPLRYQNLPFGFVTLVHDLSFIERREARTRQFLLLAFGFLAVATSGVTMIAVRLAWHGWTTDFRIFLRGGRRPEFQPLMHDVRQLVDRLVSERQTDGGGTWTPQRLKDTLNRHLQGEKVVVIANREPYIHEYMEGGDEIRILNPASGLVTALEPVMRACSGTWIAHGSGSADRETTDRNSRLRVPPGEESYVLRRLWLSREEEHGYYYGLANEGLWPLCHIAHARPIFRSEDWQHYKHVNEKFAESVRTEVDSDDPIVLVQDYHFTLVPQLIRARLPRATVIMFWHIPWPNSQRFGICPWREELLEGMLGSSIVGFHTQFDCNNFMDSVERFLEARIDREQNAVIQHGRRTLVRAYPVSVDWPCRWLETQRPVEECRQTVWRELGLSSDAVLGLGVDRLDYTKGVEERLLAVEQLLERFPTFRGRFTFLQIAAPSRTAIEGYRQLNERVERTASRINSRFGTAGYQPIVLRRSHHQPDKIFQYYRAADVCYVSSVHDGMNLVAKEFVAAREDEAGVLVLSQFTGAARELTEALIVNPYDFDEASSALAVALNMSREEQADRMRSMRTFVAEFNVYRWAGRMLVDAARVRSRGRLTDRLAAHLTTTAMMSSHSPDDKTRNFSENLSISSVLHRFDV